MTKTSPATNTAEGRYESMTSDRTPYENRARESAGLTIPSLVPPQGSSGSTELPTPWQSMGARGVNNLAAKLLLALLPTNAPFFRLSLDEAVRNEVARTPKLKTELEAALSATERIIMSDINATPIRVSLFETVKHLLVAGNGMVYLPPQGGMKLYKLPQYVVQRDTYGLMVLAIIKEEVLKVGLSKGLQKIIEEECETNPNDKSDTKVCIYTVVKLLDGGTHYMVHQELSKGVRIPNSQGLYPVDACPFLALRWAKIDGENYGRGHCEEYLGDFKTLEGLTQAVTEGSAIAAKVVLLVDPNGTTNADDINNAENGEAVAGRKDEVTTWQLEKYGDFRVAMETSQRIEQRLAQAFLLNSSVTRDAERVTAEEIRWLAGELEDALGGVYSILTQEFQLPFLRRVMARMQQQGKLPSLPKGTVKPSIITGLDALGRGHELNKIMTFTRILRETLGEQGAQQVLKRSEFAKIVGAQLGIEVAQIVNTEDELAAAAKEAQRAQTIQTLGPEAMRAAAASQQPK